MVRTRGALWRIPTRTRHLPTMQVKPVGTVGVMAWPQLFRAISCDEADQVHGTGQSVGKARAQGVPIKRQIHKQMSFTPNFNYTTQPDVPHAYSTYWLYYYKTGDVRTTSHWGAFVQPLLSCTSKKYYIFWGCVCSLTYSACNAHAPYLLSSAVCSALRYFSTLSQKTALFSNNKIWLNTKCVFWFSLQLLPETFLILRRNEPDMIKMCMYPLFLSNFSETRIFSRDFWKSTQTSNFINILPLGAEFHADGQTDRETWRSSESLVAILRTRLKVSR